LRTYSKEKESLFTAESSKKVEIIKGLKKGDSDESPFFFLNEKLPVELGNLTSEQL